MSWFHRPVHRPLFISLLVFALVLAGLITAIELSQTQQDTRTGALADEIDLTLSPQNITSNEGEVVNVDVFAHQNNLQFAAASLNITYDPTLLRFESITSGSGLLILHTATSSGDITTDVGIQCYQDNSCFQVTEAGYRIATLTFTAINPGSAPISLTPATKTAAREVFATDRTGSLQDAYIDIVDPASPTSTPTPTTDPSIPTPTPYATPTPTAIITPPPPNSSGTAYGIITNSQTGDPISNATVNLRVPGIKGKPGLVETTTSDTNGNYQMQENPGLYDIQFSAKGYLDYESNITLQSQTNTRKDAALDPKSGGGSSLLKLFSR